MRHFLCPFISLLLLFSCGSGENRVNDAESTISGEKISFEKLDSIKIDYLGNPTVHDLDPINRTVLFMEHMEFTEEIMVADFEGNIVKRFSKFGDMPDAYGLRMAPIRFLDGRKFLVYASKGFMTYDFEGNLLSSVKLEDFEIAGKYGGGRGNDMESLGNRFLRMDQQLAPNGDYSDISLYEKIYLLNWLYPKTGKVEPIIQFPESSIFRSGRHFFRSAWDPSVFLADDMIYVVFGMEPVIYAFEDSEPYSLISSIPLNLPEYRYFKGTNTFSEDKNTLMLRFCSGFIENFKKVDGYFLIAYFPGYEDEDIEMRLSNKTPEETAVFNARMTEKYQFHIAILDTLGNLINDFIPGRLEPRSMLVRNGELWIQEKPDEEVERDYFRLFRVGLKEEVRN